MIMQYKIIHGADRSRIVYLDYAKTQLHNYKDESIVSFSQDLTNSFTIRNSAIIFVRCV